MLYFYQMNKLKLLFLYIGVVSNIAAAKKTPSKNISTKTLVKTPPKTTANNTTISKTNTVIPPTVVTKIPNREHRELVSLQEEYKTLKNKYDDLQEQLVEFKQDMENLLSKNMELINQITMYKTRISQLEQESKNLKSTIDKNQKETKELQNKLKIMSQKNLQLKELVNSLKNYLSDLNNLLKMQKECKNF